MNVGAPMRRRESGVTVLELLVGSVVMVVFLAAVSASFGVTLKIWQISGPTAELDSQSFRAIEQIAGRLMRAGDGTIFPAAAAPTGSSSISFRTAEGLSGAQAVWGEEIEYSFALDPNELEDGADNDNDGLIDEGMVIWRKNPGTAQEVWGILARGVAPYLEGETDNGVDDNGNGLVDERGFSVVREGELITVRMTLMRSIRDGEAAIRTVSTTIRIRN